MMKGWVRLYLVPSVVTATVMAILMAVAFNWRVRRGRTESLCRAASGGDVSKAKSLLAQDAGLVNAEDAYGRTPLEMAVRGGHVELVRLLLASGADVNLKGEISLHIAAEKGYKEIAGLLLDNGAEVNARDGGGETPLHKAASYGPREVVSLLLANGAEVNAKDLAGRAPLHEAAMCKRIDIAAMLLAQGADVNARDFHGLSPADLAGGGDFVHFLVKHGARTR